MNSRLNPIRMLCVIFAFGLLAFFSGCVSSPISPAQQPGGQQAAGRNCTIITEQVPYVESECRDVEVTRQVCGIRALEYSQSQEPITSLCVMDGNCTGISLSKCQVCTMASTRCGLNITNKDPDRTGIWVVGANFTVTNGGFIRDPIARSIGPGETGEFDFQQMYNPGAPPNSADCDLYITSAPRVDECHDETRMQTECLNVTRYRASERSVCP